MADTSSPPIPADQSQSTNIYGYTPSEAAAIVYIILFSLSGLLHLYQTVRSRFWFTIVFFVCACGEVAGWVGRFYSHDDPYNIDAFLAQICLILSPNFSMAGLYAIFSIIVNRLGRKYAIMRPWLYPTIFIIFDVLSLVIQAIGGGMAAVALQNNEDSTAGTWIMFAGVVFQFICLSVFVVLALNYAKKAKLDYTFDTIGKRFKWLCLGMAISTAFLLLRAAYRAAELGDGWTGFIMVHEPFFVFLDALPAFVSLIAINLTHPLYTMPESVSVKSFNDKYSASETY